MGNERNDGFRDALEVAATAEYEYAEEPGQAPAARAILEALRHALDAREARQRLSPGTWSPAPPIVSGPYWLKRSGEAAQVVRVEVFRAGGPGTVYEPGCNEVALAAIERSALWHGPLSEPD
jgi:hypothetical protein